MSVFSCFVQNNTGSFVRVVIASPFGQAPLTLGPGSFASIFLQSGTKTLSAFDQATGGLVSLYPFLVSGPEVFEVQPTGVTVLAPVRGTPSTVPALAAPPPGVPSF